MYEEGGGHLARNTNFSRPGNRRKFRREPTTTVCSRDLRRRKTRARGQRPIGIISRDDDSSRGVHKTVITTETGVRIFETNFRSGTETVEQFHRFCRMNEKILFRVYRLFVKLVPVDYRFAKFEFRRQYKSVNRWTGYGL